MGLLSGIKASLGGRRAYIAHVKGNRAGDAGRPDEARTCHEQAMKWYAEAVSNGCVRVVYLMAYGVLLLRMREFEKAREIFKLAEKQPTITKAERKQLRINYAICQWKTGQLDQAIGQLKIAASDGNNSMIYGSLGFMLIEQGSRTGDYAEALKFNTEAYEYDEDDAVVLDNLGQLHLRMDQRDKALEYFKRAHEIKPGQVDTLYYLAKLAHEDGDNEAARRYLDRALSGSFSALCTITREQAQQLRDQIGD